MAADGGGDADARPGGADPLRALLLGGLRRFATLFAFAAAAAAVLGLVVAGAAHERVLGGIAIGFYVVGTGLCVFGFLLGSRPPVRMKDERSGGFAGLGRWVSGGVRFATRTEHEEALNVPAILVALGICLIVVGVLVDPRHPV